MTKYWANAIAIDETTGRPKRLFTYNALASIEACDDCFMTWGLHKDPNKRYPYRLLITWIDAVYDCGSRKMIHKKEYI